MPHDHADDDPAHSLLPSDPALRVKALETILVAKGLVDPAAMEAILDTYERKVGPHLGAKLVARAWADARVQRIYGGTNEIMKEVIARSL